MTGLELKALIDARIAENGGKDFDVFVDLGGLAGLADIEEAELNVEGDGFVIWPVFGECDERDERTAA